MWMFDNVEIIELKASVFKKIRLNRNNRFYGFLLNICELIYNSSLPAEKEGTWRFIDFTRDKRKMNQLFEAFIRNFYKKEQKIYPVVKKEQIKWQFKMSDTESVKYLPIMETDITLENESSKIIMDAKFYTETMSSYYDSEKINSSNLYQLYSYILNQRSDNKKTHNTVGVLISPTIEKEYNLKYAYEDHNIFIKTINLNNSWKGIDKRLKDIIKEVSNFS